MNDFVTAGLADGLAERGVPFKGPRDRSGGAARHCYLGTHRATEGSAPSPGGISAASSRVNLPAGTRGTKSSSSQEAEALVPSEPRPPPPPRGRHLRGHVARQPDGDSLPRPACSGHSWRSNLKVSIKLSLASFCSFRKAHLGLIT